LGILVFQVSFCQEAYLPAYIVSLNGDTIQGFIDYRNWGTNPEYIAFKNSPETEKTIYKPIDIRSFGVKDERYVSAIVNTEISSRNTNTLEQNAILNIKVDTAFLQTMISGDKSLFYYKNRSGIDNFYIKNQNEFQLLEYKKYIKFSGGPKILTENKKYVGQLMVYFNDCPSLQSKINQVKYSKKNLENLFLSYYACSQSEINFQKKTEKIKIESGFLVGASLTGLKFSGSTSFDYLLNTDYNQSIKGSAGLYLNLVIPRLRERWSIYNELLYTSYQVNGTYNDIQNENTYVNYYTEFGYSYFKINTLVRYQYPVGNFSFCLNAGMSNGFGFNEINYLEKVSIFYTTEHYKEGEAIDDPRTNEQGLVVGLGTKFKKLSLETRLEKANGMSKYPGLGSVTNRFYILVGYQF